MPKVFSKRGRYYSSLDTVSLSVTWLIPGAIEPDEHLGHKLWGLPSELPVARAAYSSFPGRTSSSF